MLSQAIPVHRLWQIFQLSNLRWSMLYLDVTKNQFILHREHTAFRLESGITLFLLRFKRNTNTLCAVLHSVLRLAVPTVAAGFLGTVNAV